MNKTVIILVFIVVLIVAFIIFKSNKNKQVAIAAPSTKITRQVKTGGAISGLKGIFDGLNLKVSAV